MEKRFVFVITLTFMLIWSSSSADASDLFAAAVKYPTGAESYGFTTEDFNSNGNIDLATATDGSVSVILGKGDGTFHEAKVYNNPGYTSGIIAGDFNSDGKPDLVVAMKYLGGISIFNGNGDGTFQPVKFFGTGTYPLDITSGDFNRDGKSDIALANIFDYVSILIGNGDGTFQLYGNYQVGDLPGPIITGDFNNDGVVDLATSNLNSGNISILMGNGDGTFQSMGGGYCSSAFSITTGDFNGDGKKDIATPTDVCIGNGDGTFQPGLTYNSYWSLVGVTSGDFDGDQKLDLATSDTSGNVSVFIGNGDATFQPKITYTTGDANYQITTKDLDNDGQLDLITANGGGHSISVLLNIYNKPTPIPPVVTLYATPTVLWPPNGEMVDVFVGGDVYDPDSGIASLVFTVTDEYGQVQPSLSGFNTSIKLEARRDGKDQDGRRYTITAAATDATGNRTTASTVVLVPHEPK